jgi:hypothetical protein
MKDIEINIDQKTVVAGTDITGTVRINYDGRFDGVQVNTYITGSNDYVHFTSLEGKKISLISRLFVDRQTIGEERSFKFTARVDQSSQKESSIRFRAAMIQEHKEIASDTVFVPLRAE